MALLWGWAALAGALTAPTDGEPLVVPILEAGSLVVLPEAVALVSPSQRAELTPIAGSERGTRHFEVTWLGNTIPEVVIFELGSGAVLPVLFVPLAEASAYTEIRWPDATPGRAWPDFAEQLAGSLALMREMLAARPAPGDRPLSEVAWSEDEATPALTWRLVRRFEGPRGLEGLELTVRNDSARAVQIEPARLALGEPGSVWAVQIDVAELPSCHGRRSACATTVRIVRTAMTRPGPIVPFVRTP